MITVGVDIGGSGARLALRGAASARAELPTLPASVVAADPRGAVAQLGARARELADGAPIAAVAIGAAGLSTHAEDPQALTPDIARAFDAARAVVTSDIVTAHLGALGGEPGAVLAAGTGAIALGTDLSGTWHRVDGWGHLLGDLGSGAWIGMEALRAAAEQLDGRRADAPALAARATRRFGPPLEWPGHVYRAVDRARILGSFVPEVLEADDDASAQVLADAARHLARSLTAALVPGVPERVALTGGLSGATRLTEGVLTHVRDARPGVSVVGAQGSPLDGALVLAALLTEDPDPLPGHTRVV
ncbi:N-acetylglucosamine kinase [Microbacterium sp. G2-8]|uniref:N-acetylglucosamine kinase n=1 Tax=Microbacterium sp. G2-8 TaxID=2842454 RepID=UPI001C89D435|nr:BadF/BadG/BcrA/BcrD ATPase family protein [Microbacterium sp. G2-8]